MLPDVPDAIKPIWKKTLVLNLGNSLVHSTYTMGIGFEIVKRPYLEEFLRELADQYEIIVWADEELQFVIDICKAIDPHRYYIMASYGRESTALNWKLEHEKKIKYLNRDLNKIVMIEWDTKRQTNFENTIYVTKFDKSMKDDDELLKLVPYLKYLATVDDVRTELKSRGSVYPHHNFDESEVRDKKIKKLKKSG